MTKHKKRHITNKLLMTLAVIVVLSGLSINGVLFTQRAAAESSLEQQIQQLRTDNQFLEKQSYELRKKAETLQGEVDVINQHKAQIQLVINQINQRIKNLNADIAKLELEIDDNQDALGDVIAKMYLASQVSTIERLASSRAITDFIDEEAKQHNLRQTLSLKLKEIRQQREVVTQKKNQQVKALKEQQAQMDAQRALEAEKQKLLEETKGDESLYRQMAKRNNDRIEELRLKQQKINCENSGGSWTISNTCHFHNNNLKIPGGTPGGGGYPGKWAFAPIDYYVDPWGLYTRECVSYVAWKINSTGRFVPHFGGQGNANQWPATTARHGIAQGSQPRAGAAAVITAGYYGHVMYVEAVYGDGTILVSDYNLNWDGNYRIYRRSAAGLIYIYF